jgi:uncharacterized small protein (DUF1192 family)
MGRQPDGASIIMALDADDLEPRIKKPAPRDLETLSIEELEASIAEMTAEIERMRQVIARKQNQRAGAEAFFKKR